MIAKIEIEGKSYNCFITEINEHINTNGKVDEVCLNIQIIDPIESISEICKKVNSNFYRADKLPITHQ